MSVLHLFDSKPHQILQLDPYKAQEHKGEEGVADQLMDRVSAVAVAKLGYNLHEDQLLVILRLLRLLAGLLHTHPLYGFKQVYEVLFEHGQDFISDLRLTIDRRLGDE